MPGGARCARAFPLPVSSLGLQNRVGAIFFILMNTVFGNLSAIEIFLKERVVFMHESASGYYARLPYMLAKVKYPMEYPSFPM